MTATDDRWTADVKMEAGTNGTEYAVWLYDCGTYIGKPVRGSQEKCESFAAIVNGPDLPPNVVRQQAIDAEVYKAALIMACVDGWADGAGAFEHYVGCARQAVASAQDAPTPQTERVPLGEALGRKAPHNGGMIIGVYMELDDMRPVLNTSDPNLDKFMAGRSPDGTVEVLR